MTEKTTKYRSQLDAVMEAIDAAIVTIDSDGIIVDTNEATCRMFGHGRAQLLGNNVKMLMPEPYQSDHDQFVANHLRTGVNRIIGNGRKVSGVTRSGLMFPVHLSVAKFYDEDQVYFTGILHDLTELDEVISKNYKLGQIIEESVNEVYTFDSNSLRFTSVNRAAQQNLGYRLEELRKITVADVMNENNKQIFHELLQPLINGDQKRVALSTAFVRKDGTEYDIEGGFHFSTVSNPPEIALIVQDITEKKKLSDALRHNQRMESIGNLTGGIAHDFNNILTVVIGNLELLEDDITSPEELSLLTSAKEAADMGARLTHRLLAFARRSSLSPDNVNINALIEDISGMLERTLGGSVKLKNVLAQDLWNTSIDTSELENALVNLAINARDAMPRGGQLIIETCNAILDDETVLGKELLQGRYVKISVTDTGTGIADEVKETLFEPFVTTKSKGARGSGLGLSMVYGFVRQSGGAITVYSEKDKGTVFSIYLPESGTGMPANTSDSEYPNRPMATRRILIAEDDAQVRRLTIKRLEKLGHEVLVASDGHEALAIFREAGEVDLVFTDVVMTEGMSGYDLALAVRALRPEQPVLLVSGYAEDIVNRETLDEMGLQLLRKPYNQDDLQNALNELIV
jgi:PAS domain S-box-containing protein